MKSRTLVRLGNGILALGIATTAVSGLMIAAALPALAATAGGTSGSSEVTVRWADDHSDVSLPDYSSFQNLAVTVSQTKNLASQGVSIDWTGGKATSVGDYATDFLQIMQCWGDETTGPTPQSCQWGAPSTAANGLVGTNVAGRDLSIGQDPLQDPELVPDSEFAVPPPPENPAQKAFRVPFRTASGAVAQSANDLARYFDASTSNEVTGARTGNDGTGHLVFETQTSLEAPHLGCGAAASDGSIAPCWLVIVPRGTHNLDGSLGSTNPSARINGSPLSATAWANRLVVELDFAPVSQSCPLGNAEQRLVGSDVIAAAITSWQPALCRTGTTYGFSLIGDDEARRQIVSDVEGASRLALVSDPIEEFERDDATIAYAPVAASSIVVAFQIDYRLKTSSPILDRNGLLVEDLTLNARLVAKLLTQSYRIDVPGLGAKDPVVSANPRSVLEDPEFLALNPDFASFTSDAFPAGLMVALGNTDANAEVWSWLQSDPVAAEFLAGTPDEWGMKLNPSYSSLDLAHDTSIDYFPKADLTIASGGDPDEPGYGTLDMRPYTNDMLEAAYRTLRADPGWKYTWDPTKLPPAYAAIGAQLPGTRFVLSITDAASAARYGLRTANLVNAAGQAIAPTSTSVGKAIAAMEPSEVAGVDVIDPTKRVSGAYPLPSVTYAAVNVCESTAAQLKSYSDLISYGVGAGQVPGEAVGTLPEGYQVLSEAKLTQARATAASLADGSAAASCSTPTPSPEATSTPEPTSTPEVTPTADPTADPVEPAPPIVIVPQDTTTTDEETVPVVPEDPFEPDNRTVDAPLGLGTAGFAGALIGGIPLMAVGPILAGRGRRLARLEDLGE